jgi:hypothetical protein
MSRSFDYNGSIVSPSTAVKKLRTVKKTLLVDSSDRDVTRYFTNGEFVIYLPRTYENVVSIRLMAAEFPPIVAGASTPGALVHSYSRGNNLSTAIWTSDTLPDSNTHYFLIDMQGLNKTDECALESNRSGFTDSYFAKIPILLNSGIIEYNDHSGQENIARYSPAIGKLDRLHIRTRLHNQQGNEGFLYWTTDGSYPLTLAQQGAEYSMSFEIEYLDNVFDEFSTVESRLTDRS